MITEDYVSFEIAKLLKEKGFDDVPVYTYYLSYGGFYRSPMAVTNKDLYAQGHIAAPTLQMAMKWLREVHNISIEPLVDFGSGDEYWWSADVAYVKKNGLIDTLTGYSSYEQVCEAVIKYCLENLI